MCCVAGKAAGDAYAPLKLEDPVVRLIKEGGKRGKRDLIRPSRTLLLPVYSPFPRGGYCLFALFLWQRVVPKCVPISPGSYDQVHTMLNPASCQE